MSTQAPPDTATTSATAATARTGSMAPGSGGTEAARGPAAQPAHAPARRTRAGGEPAASGTGKGPRLALLDGLRLVAALAVVLFHYTAWHHGYFGTGQVAHVWPTLSHITVLGDLGVQLFFLLSGLVVFRSLQGRSTGRFLGSRIGRVMPALWVAVLLSGLLQMLLWRTPQPGLTWGDLGWNLTLVGAPLHGAPWVDGVYWTLWIEARFYVMLLLVRAVLRWGIARAARRRGEVPGSVRTEPGPGAWTGFCAAWIAAGTLVIAIGGIPATDSYRDWALTPTYCGLFAGGMMLHLVAQHGLTRWRLVVLAAAAAQSAWTTALALPGQTEQVTGIHLPAAVYVACVLGFFGLIAAVLFTRAARVQWAWLTAAGALTYPVYLLHEVPGWFLIDHLSPVLAPGWVLALTLTAVLLAAWCVHRFVERPLGPRLSRLVASVWSTGFEPRSRLREPAR